MVEFVECVSFFIQYIAYTLHGEYGWLFGDRCFGRNERWKMLTAIDHKQNRTQTKDWLNEMQYWKSPEDLQHSLNLENLKCNGVSTFWVRGKV